MESSADEDENGGATIEEKEEERGSESLSSADEEPGEDNMQKRQKHDGGERTRAFGSPKLATTKMEGPPLTDAEKQSLHEAVSRGDDLLSIRDELKLARNGEYPSDYFQFFQNHHSNHVEQNVVTGIGLGAEALNEATSPYYPEYGISCQTRHNKMEGEGCIPACEEPQSSAGGGGNRAAKAKA